MVKEKIELIRVSRGRGSRRPLKKRSRVTRLTIAVFATFVVFAPIPVAGEWTFTTIPRSDEETLPSRLSYEVTFVESTFGGNDRSHRQIAGFFSETKQHGSLVVETSIRLPKDHAIRSCDEGFDARQNTSVVEQYKRENRSLISRVLGTHREYVDMSLVFGERLVRGDVTGTDERELKLAVSLRTYSEDVRVAMSDFTRGFRGFGPDVTDAIEKVVPGLDVASLAFNTFTRRYHTSVCAERYFPLQDLAGLEWIVFHNRDNGDIDTAGINNIQELTERLSSVGGYSLFSIDVKDYHCRTTRRNSQRQCELATQLMRDWLGASQLSQTGRAADWPFQWEVDFSLEASPDVEKKDDAKGHGMSALVSKFKLDEHIGNYQRDKNATFPTWTVLGALWRDRNDGNKCLEDFTGELTFSDRAGEELAVQKLSISNVKYDGSVDSTLSRQGKRTYPSEKKNRLPTTRCRCLRNRNSADCTK